MPSMLIVAAGMLLCGLLPQDPEFVGTGRGLRGIQFELKTNFHVAGRLVITNVPGETSMPMHMQMVVLKGQNVQVMKSMKDFRGNVSITGPNQALQ